MRKPTLYANAQPASRYAAAGKRVYYCYWPRDFPNDSDCADSLAEIEADLAGMPLREEEG